VTPVLLALLASAAPILNEGTLMVLPLRGQADDADLAWIGPSVADALPRALARLGVPVVDRSDRLRAHELLGIPAVALTRATSIRMAEALGVSRIVEGGFTVDGPKLSLSLRILDVARGTLSAPLIAAGPVETLPALVGTLAWDVALAGPTPPRVTRDVLLAGIRRAPPLEAQRRYGRALTSRDPAERRRLLREALRLAPAYDEARVALGELQVEARESAAALDTLKRVSPSSPQARTARFLAGRADLDLGRYHDAAKAYASLSGDSPTVGVLNNYALALLRRGGGAERASDVLKRAIERDAAAPEPPFNLGWALLREGEPGGAAFWMRGVLRSDPRDVHARLILVWSLRQSGSAPEAEDEWRRLLLEAPAYEAFAAPDLERRFERTMTSDSPPVLDPDRWGDAQLAAAHLGRGRKLEDEGDHEAALAELTQAAYLDPYGADVHRALARVYRAQGDSEKAAGEVRMSLWCKDDPGARVELAALLQELGRKGEARAEARRALKANPSDPEARRIAEGR
jgi:tetratricopeptide (TPR) repeat protein/TolB-like protein